VARHGGSLQPDGPEVVRTNRCLSGGRLMRMRFTFRPIRRVIAPLIRPATADPDAVPVRSRTERAARFRFPLSGLLPNEGQLLVSLPRGRGGISSTTLPTICTCVCSFFALAPESVRNIVTARFECSRVPSINNDRVRCNSITPGPQYKLGKTVSACLALRRLLFRQRRAIGRYRQGTVVLRD